MYIYSSIPTFLHEYAARAEVSELTSELGTGVLVLFQRALENHPQGRGTRSRTEVRDQQQNMVPVECRV